MTQVDRVGNIEHDDLGAELSGMEQDVLAIHDALVDAGLDGAINAPSIIERIGHLKGAVDRAESAESLLVEALQLVDGPPGSHAFELRRRIRFRVGGQ